MELSRGGTIRYLSTKKKETRKTEKTDASFELYVKERGEKRRRRVQRMTY